MELTTCQSIILPLLILTGAQSKFALPASAPPPSVLPLPVASWQGPPAKSSEQGWCKFILKYNNFMYGQFCEIVNLKAKI